VRALHPELEALRRIGTCAAANAIETFGVRLKNEGFTDGSLQCMADSAAPIIGYAMTVKIRCSTPPAIGPDYLERTEWWNHLVAVAEPRIVVIEDDDPATGTGALVGEVHANLFQALGCVGVVTNGAVRDLPALRAMPFPAFASRTSVSHAYAHIVELGGKVTVGGLKIASGDLLLADCHGVLSIPPEIAADIPAVAARIASQEQKLIAVCRRGNASIDELREAVRETRHEVHAMQSQPGR